MSTYQRLTEQARSINEEREALLFLKKQLESQLRAVEKRLSEADTLLNDNYNQQEEHWNSINKDFSLVLE